jgi:thiol-disulfide isomerase/thioredoxin
MKFLIEAKTNGFNYKPQCVNLCIMSAQLAIAFWTKAPMLMKNQIKAFFLLIVLNSFVTQIVAQGSKSNDGKVNVFIHKQAGKIYTWEDLNGNFGQWVPEGKRYEFNSNVDTVFYYIDSEYQKTQELKLAEIQNQLFNKAANLEAMTDIHGNRFDHNDYRNKVVVLNFWGTWCQPCVAEIPELNQLVATYKDQDVLFLAPTNKDDQTKVENFLKRMDFNYHIIPEAHEVSRKFSVYVPTHVIIDRNGIVRFFKIGMEKGQMHDILAQEINKYL